MARKRIDFGEAGETKLRSMMAAGHPAEDIARALRADGIQASRSLVGGRMRELRGIVAPRLPPMSKSIPAPARPANDLSWKQATEEASRVETPAASDEALPTPDEIDNAPPERLPSLLDAVRQARQKAASDGNISGIGAMGRLELQIENAIAKRTPPEKPDPNDAPDMVAGAARARTMLAKGLARLTSG